MNAGIFSSVSKSALVRSIAWIAGCLAIPSVWANLIIGLFAAVAVIASVAAAPGMIGVLGAGLALVMVMIAVVDGRNFIIPNLLTAAGVGLAIVHAAAQEPDAMVRAVTIAIIRGAALALMFLMVRDVYARLRGQQGLGLGDVKLAGVAGAWLGWSMMPVAVEIAALTALVSYFLRQLVLGRPMRATNRVPFGLFFAPAIWVCWLLETMVQ